MRKRKSFRYQGQRFASKAERDFANYLDNAYIQWQYEPESFQWIPPRKKYTPDFKILRKNGSYFFVEFKGYLRPTDRTKMREIKKQYPDLDIRFVFMRANKKLYKGSKTTYAEWAENHGYLWAEGRIPEAWLKEAA